ncbi:MAG: twin-arginine translocase TatA/TatE family subunit [Nitrososphaeraceae archaeon]
MFYSSAIMNIGGSEWIIIGLMALFLLFGSKKLPEFSRMMGRVVGEYEKARMIAQREMAQSIPSQPASYHGPNIQGPVNSEREKLEMVAMSLGIESRNKNDDELRDLISDKIKNQ